jgi:hypothetical protein
VLAGDIPIGLKIAHTAFVAVLVPVYWRYYGPANFLWFSDVALLGIMAGLWLESTLRISMMAVSALLPELAWNMDLLTRLVLGRHP